jgi:hypothetical protein
MFSKHWRWHVAYIYLDLSEVYAYGHVISSCQLFQLLRLINKQEPTVRAPCSSSLLSRHIS